jgi:uroporphyrinogen III methyltransferase/synthase
MAATTRRGSFVSFVSLGPGDPALRVARATARLSEADVVVTDAEIEADTATGKAAGARLVALAREGKHVARAVAGDVTASVPVLREVLAVAAAGVGFEVVPGVGARAAGAAFAGLVGKACRASVAEVEREVAGEPGEAVVTLVERPGLPSQRVVVTTAAEAVARARTMDPGPYGLVVSLGAPDETLRWFERQPLFGKRVLVTRAREQAGSAEALLRDAGAEPVVVPTIVLGPPDDPAPLARAVAGLRAGAYAWVAFTSANGVEHTWQAVVAAGADARAFGAARLAAIGPATAAALEKHGLLADVQAREFKGEGLADEMLKAMGPAQAAREAGRARVLIARAAKAREVLPEALRSAGWDVDVVAAYQTRPPERASLDALVRELEAGRIDVVTFTSSSTVENLCDLLGEDASRLLARTRVASIGPITTETARARGLRVDVTASEYTLPGLVGALARAI